MDRKILIQFPTRSRPSRFLKVLDRYYDYMNNKENYIINICCDDDDGTMNNNDIIQKLEERNYNVNFWLDKNKNKIEATNRHITEVELEPTDIIILASDDMVPEVEGWDDILRKTMDDNFPDGDGVLHFNDGHWGKQLNTLSILGKKYFDRTGFIYNPVYLSLYADNEFMEVSKFLKKAHYSSQCIIRHVHPTLHSAEVQKMRHEFGIHADHLLGETQALVTPDKEAYNKRVLEGFGFGEEGKKYWNPAQYMDHT